MIKRFDLYINTTELGLMQVADVALLEEQGLINTVGFRYTADYLAQPRAFAIDPVQLPLSSTGTKAVIKPVKPKVKPTPKPASKPGIKPASKPGQNSTKTAVKAPKKCEWR